MLSIASPAMAYRVAILPLAELTLDRNGINLAVTQQLGQQLQQQGIDTIDQERVLTFMSQHGLRRCGEIDSFSCRKLAKELNCDAVLVATMFSNPKTADQTCIILTLLHGTSGQPIWSATKARHLNDEQPLFGIKTQKNLTHLQNQLLHMLAQQLIRDIPRLPEVSSKELPLAQIAEVQITPAIIKGGQPVHCRLNINFIGTKPDSLCLRSGNHAVILHQTTIPNIYTGSITAETKDGDHNLDLSMRWFANKEQKITNLSSYQVANEAAQLSLDLLTGLQLDNSYAFNNSIKVVAKMVPPRPIDKWCFSVLNNKGQTVFSEQQYTDLPPEMRWRGTDNNRRKLDNGHYTLAITTQDIAGNEAQATAELYLQSTDLEMVTISQHIERGEHKLELLPAETLHVPVENWSITLETPDGTTVYTTRGYQLPAVVIIPPTVAKQGLICQFHALDKLGNHYKVSDTRIDPVAANGMLAQIQPDKKWKVDF